MLQRCSSTAARGWALASSRYVRALSTSSSGAGVAPPLGGGSSGVVREHLIPPTATIAAPPAPARSAPNTFEMRVVFLGYGVGRFELEMLRGSPQLSPDTSGLTSFSKLEPVAPVAPSASRRGGEEVSSRFDLSAPASSQGSTLKSSWASSRASQAALGQREPGEAEPRFSDAMQFGSHPPPSSSSSSRAPSSSFDPSPSPSVDSSTASFLPSPTSMPSNNRVIVHSSVVLYQNVFFCWSPTTLAEVTVESLAFLRVLTPRPELILLGSGREISSRLPDDVLAYLRGLGIGIEVMDSGNAIATYNILTDEGRTVLAAMVQKPEPSNEPKKETRSQQMRRKLGYWVG